MDCDEDSSSDEDVLHGWDEVLPGTLLNYDTNEYVVLNGTALLQGNRQTGAVRWLLVADGVDVFGDEVVVMYQWMKRSFLAK